MTPVEICRLSIPQNANALAVCASIDDFKALAEEENPCPGQLLMIILEALLKSVGD